MKKIIIIGASSGIGRELALIYAKNGHKVGVCGRRLELLCQLRDQYPQNMEVAELDITKEDAGIVLGKLIEKTGGMDVLIIPAGVGFINPSLDAKIEQQTIDVNVAGFTNAVISGYAFFAKQRHGHIVGISSIAAIRGLHECPAYSASKAYELNYLEGIRKKALKENSNIKVTTVIPGFVDTQMAQGDGLFWVAPVPKAARQIVNAVEKKKSIVYVTRRWGIIAWLLKILPCFIYDRA